MTLEPGTYFTYDDEGNGWCLLATIMVVDEPHSRQRAVEQVVAVGQKLHWPADDLTQLRLTLSEAVQKRSNRRPLAGLIVVRVFLRQAMNMRILAGPTGAEAGDKTARGWGFFLVQKREEREDDVPVNSGQVDVIELFLYQE